MYKITAKLSTMIFCGMTTLVISMFVCDAACYMMNQQPVDPCYGICSCTPDDTDWGSAVNVQCGDRNLRSVPSTINDKLVSILNASFNVLKTLEEDALLSYESVRYLYLQDCKIINISEKAFQRLENLTVIDLSINRLTTISPNLFNSNHLLDKLILGNNYLGMLQWNTPILNGPSSLSFLDLQSCKLRNISSITFSLLFNLKFLDISRNELMFLNPDILSSHQNLEEVNLENNPLKCGTEFERLFYSMQSKLSLSHSRKVTCRHKDGKLDIWVLEKRSSLFRPITPQSTGEFVTIMTADLTTVSVGVSLLPKASLYTSRVVETAVTSEVNTLKGEFVNVMTVDLTTVSASFPLSPKSSLHTSRVVETAVTSEVNTLKGEFVTVMTADLTTVSASVPLSPKTSLHTSRVLETAVTSEVNTLKGEFVTIMTADLTTFPASVPLSPKTSLLTSRVVETAVTSEAELRPTPERETGGWAILLSWNVYTVMVFVILPITLGVAVFVSLIAVNYVTKRCRVHRPQSSLNPQLRIERTNQPSGDVNRSSENTPNNEYHVYEEIP